MRVVLADLKGYGGFVNKDTIAGGYGSRFRGISTTTCIIERMRKFYQNLPSIQLGYLAAIFTEAGHEVKVTEGKFVDGDLALVLTSIVDYRHEIQWAEETKRRFGTPVGFYGTFATHIPEKLVGHGDFIIKGEPEHAAMRLANGEILSGTAISPALQDLDSLPFPRWDLVSRHYYGHSHGRSMLPARSTFPVLTSRSCPEFCTYCPHRITAEYRSRSPQNVLDELERLCRNYAKPFLIFRDPLFTEERERSTAIAEGILRRKLRVRFECETRLDNLDKDLLDLLHRAGLRAMTFGIESMDPATLKRVGRRPIPPAHQKDIISYCRKKGISTHGFYVFGFLTDTVESIQATIDYAIDLDTTMALFKILTPYPGTPLRKQMDALIAETDLEKFDGYTPTFRHPNLSNDQLLYLLKSAYARFYMRPSWGWSYLGLPNVFGEMVQRWDAYARRRQLENDIAYFMSQEPKAGNS
ncbi:MAG: radical SAM protein [Acidobacteria bacterium]|nr:radical SAM protein [Acidobacteriota bacterium]MBI3657378.1 radical SAM protein [Acidobacteriota bacterium]